MGPSWRLFVSRALRAAMFFQLRNFEFDLQFTLHTFCYRVVDCQWWQGFQGYQYRI